MQRVVVDPKVVSHLVHDSHTDLLNQLVEILGNGTQRSPIKGDDVGHDKPSVVLTLGQRHTLVQAKKVFGQMVVLDHNHDIVHELAKFFRQCIKRVTDDAFKPAPIDDLHRRETTGMGGDGPTIAR